MSFKVIYPKQAERDLIDVYEYIAFKLLKPEMDSLMNANPGIARRQDHGKVLN